ncbi:MAG TPA: tetratricopeptide repeat protein [Chloroflexia bacterium]|nr:tetratricopeptide repeat protein [Chloroflexia bacterium]
MDDSPRVELTFLFTDIEGSTRLWDHHPEAMRHALSRHDALVRGAIEAHGGQVFATAGDAFSAAFPDALGAVAAVLAAQRGLLAEPWTLPTPLRARMAVHTGAAQVRDGVYHAHVALNRLSRVLAAAHGGQTLLSSTSAARVRGRLPPGVNLRDLGERQLRDLKDREQLFQLDAPDLPGEFPPLRTLDSRPNNLPAQPTTLVGREADERAVAARLQDPATRLLTLTGPGGTGKTRLGLHLAAHLLDEYEHGVWFVGLASVGDPALVASTVAGALAVKEAAGLSIGESLRVYLRDKHLLLLLDNFEHVLGAAPLVADLLATAPRLKILATSRACLRVYGEHEMAVPPLALPDRAALPDLEQVAGYPAVRLFVDRARAVAPDFTLTHENVATVVAICARLDGLPLAIELAAARARLFTPQAMMSRLAGARGTSPLHLLSSGARDLPARQQSLRGAIAWSYDLLEADEQALFARLAVFQGGCSVAAVAAVCRDGDDTAPVAAGSAAAASMDLAVLDGLESLAEKSLLRPETTAEGEPRFVMLETIREYALERLAARDEATRIRGRHLAYFRALAEKDGPALNGPDQRAALAQLDREHDNVRAALSWALEQHDGTAALALGGAIWRFWEWRGHWSEGRRWMDAALALCDGVAADVREKAWHGTGVLAYRAGDLVAADRYYREALALRRSLGDHRAAGATLNNLGLVAYERGDYAGATALYKESLAVFREIGNDRGIAAASDNLGLIAYAEGDYARAARLCGDSLAFRRTLGDRQWIAISLNILGMVAREQGAYDHAAAYHAESLGFFRELQDRWGIATALTNQGLLAADQGDVAQAAELQRESLRLFSALANQNGVARALAALGALATTRGDHATATRLLAGSEALRLQTSAPRPVAEQQRYERSLASARAALGPTAFAVEWQRGHTVPADDLVSWVLDSTAGE